MTVAQAVSRLTGLVVTVLAARVLAPDLYGLYAMAMAGAAVVATAADFGLDTVLVREMTVSPASRGPVLTAGLVLKTFLAALGVGGLIVYALATDEGSLFVGIVVTLGCAVGLRHAATTLWMPNRADERMGSEAMAMVATDAMLLLSVAFALMSGLGLLGLGGGYALAGVAALVMALVGFARRDLTLRLPDPELMVSLARRAAVFGSAMFASALYGRVAGTLLLGWLVGPTAAGLFDVAYKVIPLLIVIPAAFGTAALPAMSRHLSSDPAEVGRICERLATPLFGFAGAAMVGGALIGGSLLSSVLGAAYHEGGELLGVFLVAVPAVSMNVVFFNALLAAGRQSAILRIVLLVGVVSLPAHVVAIKYFSVWGAVVVTVFAEWAVFLLSWQSVNRVISPVKLGRGLWIALLPMMAVGFTVWPVRHLPLLIPLTVGVLSYLTAVAIVPALRRVSAEGDST